MLVGGYSGLRTILCFWRTSRSVCWHIGQILAHVGVNVGCMLSWVGRVRCALHWEEKEVGREPKGLGGKVWGAWWMRRSERVGAEGGRGF